MLVPNPDGHRSESDSDLIRRLLDGRISEEELNQIQSRLQSDAVFRNRYIQLVDLEAAFYEECSVPDSSVHSSSSIDIEQRTASQRTLKRNAMIVMVLSVICLVLGFLFLVFPGYNGPVSNDGNLAQPFKQETKEKLHGERFRILTLSETEPAPDIAILTHVSGINSDDLKVGRCFKAGTLKIPHGKIKIEFFSGALLTIVGPAELEMISKSAATLRSGKATALIPESAIGFVINATESAVVDLGTDFGIQVDKDSPIKGESLKGQAEAPLAGNAGNPIAGHQQKSTPAKRPAQEKMALPRKLEASASSPKIVENPALALPVRQQYIDAIKQARPLVYWRFEAEEFGQVRNEMGPQWPADMIRNLNEPQSLKIADGHAQFQLSKTPRMIQAADPFPQLNAGPYSIEFWIRADKVSHMTCLSVIQENDRVGIQHLNVIEIMAKQYLSNLVHDIGNIRFLQRYPPSADGKTGFNLFSRERCTPGQWMQIVVVKNHDMLELYLDGMIARRVFLNVECESSPYKLYLGQLRLVNTLRQFVGGIDEFSLYKRALGPEEIDNHFRLMFW